MTQHEEKNNLDMDRTRRDLRAGDNLVPSGLPEEQGRAAERLAVMNPSPQTNSVVLAPKHTGMKVDYSGILNQAQRGLQRDPGIAEMLRQLEEHMSELGQRWYDGDATVVDEFLQLYCIQTVRRGVIAAVKAEGQPDAG